jgi:hypothetical protein
MGNTRNLREHKNKNLFRLYLTLLLHRQGHCRQVKKIYDIEYLWVSYELHPETPPEGTLLSERFKGRDASKMYDQLRQRGKEFNIVFADRPLLSNLHTQCLLPILRYPYHMILTFPLRT